MENKFLSHLGVFAPLVRVQVFKTCGGCEQRSLSVRFRYTPVVSRYAESPGKRWGFLRLDVHKRSETEGDSPRYKKSHSETSREQAADKSEASQALDLRPHYPIAIMDHG